MIARSTFTRAPSRCGAARLCRMSRTGNPESWRHSGCTRSAPARRKSCSTRGWRRASTARSSRMPNASSAKSRCAKIDGRSSPWRTTGPIGRPKRSPCSARHGSGSQTSSASSPALGSLRWSSQYCARTPTSPCRRPPLPSPRCAPTPVCGHSVRTTPMCSSGARPTRSRCWSGWVLAPSSRSRAPPARASLRCSSPASCRGSAPAAGRSRSCAPALAASIPCAEPMRVRT